MVEISYIDTDFTEEEYRTILNKLPKERREKAKRYLTKNAAYLSAGAGYLLDCALRRKGLQDAVVLYGEHGKPYIEGLHFNLSHSGTVAVLAVAAGEVGVDIEKIAPVNEKLVRRVCTERELARLKGRDDAFFRIWTAKESAGKFLGTGIAFPKAFEVDLLCKEVTYQGEALPIREYALDGYALTACAKEEFAPSLKEVSLA